MIKDIIIVDDPFIGTKRLLNIPTGIVSVVDDLNGLYVEEFFIRLRDYMGCIQEGIPLDWIKGKTTGTKFTITWEHEKKIYGYNLVLDKDGKVFNERLLSRKKGGLEFKVLLEFTNGMALPKSTFWSVSSNIDGLLNMDLPEQPYKVPLMKECPSVAKFMSEILKRSFSLPKQCVWEKVWSLSKENQNWIKGFLVTSNLSINRIDSMWRLFSERETEIKPNLLGSGAQYLLETLPYLLDSIIGGKTFIDPSLTNHLHPLLESKLLGGLDEIGKEAKTDYQILVPWTVKTEGKNVKSATVNT